MRSNEFFLWSEWQKPARSEKIEETHVVDKTGPTIFGACSEKINP
jgi:hypothetical protein